MKAMEIVSGFFKNVVIKDGKGIMREVEILRELSESKKGIVNHLTAEMLEKNLRKYPKYISLLEEDMADNKEIVVRAEALLESCTTRQEYQRTLKEVRLFKKAVIEANENLELSLKVVKNSYDIDALKLSKLQRKNAKAPIEINETIEKVHQLTEESKTIQKTIQVKENFENAVNQMDELIASLKDSKKFLDRVKTKNENSKEEFVQVSNKKDVILEKMLAAFTTIYETVLGKLNEDNYDEIILDEVNIGYVGYKIKNFLFEFGLSEPDINIYSENGNVLFSNNSFAPSEKANINKLYINLIATNHITN